MRAPAIRLLLATLPLACLSTTGPAAAQTLTPVGGGFDDPVHVSAPPGDGLRVMVVEQGGTVRVIRDGATLPTPFLTVASDFTGGGERGLLSIAFSPDYERSRLLYAYYTDAEGDIRVDEFRRAADSRDRVEPAYRRRVIEVLHREAPNHNGGTVAFGPDGRLYLATGDGGNGYDMPNRDARDTASLLGKLLRITPTPGGGYTIPAGNPYAAPGNPGRDEVWAIGLRNPFRFSFDRANGDLFVGDVGQNTIEEVNHLPAAAGRGQGANLGWDDCEGNLLAEPLTGTAPCPLAGDVRPAIALPQSADFCSVIGGVVVRDPSVPQLAGRYLYGDLCKPRLRSYVPGSPATDREEPSLGVASPAGIGEDACGRVYVAQLGGTVARLEGGSSSCPLRVPGSGAGADGGGTGATLRVTLGGPRRQRLTRRGLLVRVRCSERCRIRAIGTLTLRRRGLRIRVRQVKRSLAANPPVAIRLKVSGPSRSAVARALRRGRRVSASITVRARDGRGRLRVARRTIRLR